MPMLEERNYDGIVEKFECGEAQTGTPFIAIVCYLPEEGTHRTIYNYITPKTEDRVIDDFEKMGYDLADIITECAVGATNNEQGLPIYELPETEQKEVTLNCYHEMYDGEPREKWRLAMGGGSSATPIKMAKLQRLKDKWQSKHGEGSPKTKVEDIDIEVSDDEIPADIPDDEIPF